MHNNQYGRLAVMTLLSFIAMFAFMYSMVDKFENVIPNLNQFYMAVTMAAPMVLIEVLVMWAMYQNRTLNLAIVAAASVATFAFFFMIREQTGVTDAQFLKSMIPHHAGAILMCEKAPLQDKEVKALCQGIVTGQRAEIAQMKAKLKNLEK
jgi:uncharacterized protein (DUF305 family)